MSSVNLASLAAGPPPARPRVVIVDDEPAARRGVRLLLDQDGSTDVVGEAGNPKDAVALIARVQPDIVFLDVQMPGGTGFDVLARLPAGVAPAVVFATAYDEHALRAFEVHAVDYLLKPYEDARFFSALARAKAAAQERSRAGLEARVVQLLEFLQRSGGTAASVEGAGTGFENNDDEAGSGALGANPAGAGVAGAGGGEGGGLTDRFLIKSSGEILFLKTEEIDWIEADGDYMRFHTAGKSHLLRETMARLEARLDPKRFVRIHRSTIVNIDRVRKLSPSFAGEYSVVLADGTKLRLSRGYHDRMQEVLKGAL